MTEAVDFAYAGARMQARYGEQPAPATWNHLERIGDFVHLVQTIRATPLAPWVSDFNADTSSHRIERGLRQAFRREVNEVAGWMPSRWRQAMAWLAWLPDLANVAHARYGRRPHDWMPDDPVAGALMTAGREDSPGIPPDLLGLVRTSDGDRTIAEDWLDAWRARWPQKYRSKDVPLERAYRQVGRLLATKMEQDRRDATVQTELRRLFRRHGRTPAGAVAYLGLLYLQFTRLRGILLRRRLFRSTA